MLPTPQSAAARWSRSRSLLSALTLGLLALGTAKCGGSSTSPEIKPLPPETFTFPTGEILTNQPQADDDYSSNQFYYQASASAPRESLQKIEQEGPPLSLPKVKPQIFRDDSRVALVVGPHVFERWERNDGPYWGETSTSPSFVANAFLRTFLKPGDRLIPASDLAHPETLSNPPVNYVFDHLDLHQNLLFTRRKSTDKTYPEFLVYSAPEYGFPLQLDLDRTRTANNLPLPNEHFTLDASVVVFPGEDNGLDLKPNPRALALALPGAKETFAKSLPLDGKGWTKIDYSFAFPTGSLTETNHFEAILGFVDPAPHRLSIYWRRVPGQITEWHFIQTGAWVIADESGFENHYTRIVFFRISE